MKNDINNNNYITIQGWMINDLNLKGNELILYALIYGFSQDGKSKFNGSLNYMMNWLNASRPTVVDTLKNLLNKNLIQKEKSEDGQICYYWATSKEDLLVKKFNSTSKKTLPDQLKNLTRTSKETLLNNNIYNNINNTNDNNISVDNFSSEDFSEEIVLEEEVKVKRIDNDFLEFAKGLKSYVENKKRIKVSNSQLDNWAKEIEKLYKKIAFRGEEQAKEDIKQAIQFLINYGGTDKYYPVVESGKSFYEKFSKIEDAMARQKEKDVWKIDTSCLDGFEDFSKFFK